MCDRGVFGVVFSFRAGMRRSLRSLILRLVLVGD